MTRSFAVTTRALPIGIQTLLFEGNATLFTGLAAEHSWDWSRRFPLIRLSFAEGVLRDRAELDARIDKLLRLNAERLGVALPDDPGVATRFSELIRLAHAEHGECVVVDLAPEGTALQEIKDRGYADKHRAEGLPSHLIGNEFSREERTLVGFEVETLMA